jgi:hypothetical protein
MHTRVAADPHPLIKAAAFLYADAVARQTAIERAFADAMKARGVRLRKQQRAPSWKRIKVRSDESAGGAVATMDGIDYPLVGGDDAAELLRAMIRAKGCPVSGAAFIRSDRIVKRLPDPIREHVRTPGGKGKRTGYRLL